MILDFSVSENLILGRHQKPPFATTWFRMDPEKISDFSDRLIQEYSIKTPNRATSVRHLSGGTQQRVVVAREFSGDPHFVVASQPTRGLDVGATEYIHGVLLSMRDAGVALLLVTADLDEVWSLADRIGVIFDGRIVAIKTPEETSIEELGLLMAGHSVNSSSQGVSN